MSTNKITLITAIQFNPKESLIKNKFYKKIPMEMLKERQRKILGFQNSKFSGGTKFRNGDTLFARITPCLENGKTAFVDILEDNEVAFGSTEFIVLRNTELTDSKFIYYLATSDFFRKKAISLMEGTSGRKRVNTKALQQFEYDFPDIKTQSKIANFLSLFDEKIEINLKINNELENLAKTIYDYWFVQFDFPDKNGNPYKSSGGEMVWNKDLKKEIPKNWEVKKLEDLMSSKRNKYNLKGNIKTDTIDLSIMPSSTFSLNLKNSSENFKTNLFELEKYDLLFGSIRPYLLKAGFSPIKGAVNGSVLSFKPFEEYCFNFLLLTLTNKNMFEYAVFNSRGTRMPVVKYEDILNYKIAFDKNTVLKFSNLELKEIISNNINQNFELSELRDFLLPILMNGQVTIK